MPLLDFFHNRPFEAEVLGLLAAFAAGMVWAYITHRENKGQCCGTCKWYKKKTVTGSGLCMNFASKCRKGPNLTDYDRTCLDWEGR